MVAHAAHLRWTGRRTCAERETHACADASAQARAQPQNARRLARSHARTNAATKHTHATTECTHAQTEHMHARTCATSTRMGVSWSKTGSSCRTRLGDSPRSASVMLSRPALHTCRRSSSRDGQSELLAAKQLPAATVAAAPSDGSSSDGSGSLLPERRSRQLLQQRPQHPG